MTPPDPPAGEAAHFRALESLYRAAPINRLFESTLEIPAPGIARIHFEISAQHNHAAGAAHGTSYFKMLDDAAFQWFEEHGGLTRSNGDRFRSMILSRGNTEDLATMYDRWLGGEPRIAPMLKQRGLSADSTSAR